MELYDIMKLGSTIVQIVGFKLEYGVYIEDVHTKTELTHRDLLTPVSENEHKWFCDNTENINFIAPNKPS